MGISAVPGEIVRKHIILLRVKGQEPFRLAATSEAERDDWIQQISAAMNQDITTFHRQSQQMMVATSTSSSFISQT